MENNKDLCGSKMSQVSEELAGLRELLLNGKERYPGSLLGISGSPAALPHQRQSGEVSIDSLRRIVKQARGLRTVNFALLVSSTPVPAQLLFFLSLEGMAVR